MRTWRSHVGPGPYMVKNNPDAARTQFQEAIRSAQRPHAFARVALVVLYLNQQKAHDALTAANDLVTYDGSNALYRLLYAAALTDTGDYSEARIQLTRILKQVPTYRDAQLQLGLVAIAQKKPKEAEEIFGKIHEAQADDIRAAMGLVNVYFSESRLERALQLLTDDLKKSPNSTATRSLLAATAARAGKYDLAIEEYQKLVSQVPNSAEPRIRLAQVYGKERRHRRRHGDVGAGRVKWARTKERNRSRLLCGSITGSDGSPPGSAETVSSTATSCFSRIIQMF